MSLSQKIWPFLFTLLFTVSSTGVFFYYHIQKRLIKHEIKHSMMAELDDSDLTQLFISADQSHMLRWEHDSEFEYNGMMYDIVRTIEMYDGKIYICWPDHKETALNQQLEKYLDFALQNEKDTDEDQSRLIDLLQKIYCNKHLQYKESNTVKTFDYTDGIPKLDYSIDLACPLTPPPELRFA